jgi:hypothetical protein
VYVRTQAIVDPGKFDPHRSWETPPYNRSHENKTKKEKFPLRKQSRKENMKATSKQKYKHDRGRYMRQK